MTVSSAYIDLFRGVNPGYWRGSQNPQILCRGSWGGMGSWGGRGSWMGREILSYLIMYRKYVRKWWLLKRNRRICPEVAVSVLLLPGKSNSFKIAWKIQILWKFAWKIDFFTRIHDPQISNQIDAAGPSHQRETSGKEMSGGKCLDTGMNGCYLIHLSVFTTGHASPCMFLHPSACVSVLIHSFWRLTCI